jgi:hypothetical protein
MKEQVFIDMIRDINEHGTHLLHKDEKKKFEKYINLLSVHHRMTNKHARRFTRSLSAPLNIDNVFDLLQINNKASKNAVSESNLRAIFKLEPKIKQEKVSIERVLEILKMDGVPKFDSKSQLLKVVSGLINNEVTRRDDEDGTFDMYVGDVKINSHKIEIKGESYPFTVHYKFPIENVTISNLEQLTDISLYLCDAFVVSLLHRNESITQKQMKEMEINSEHFEHILEDLEKALRLKMSDDQVFVSMETCETLSQNMPKDDSRFIIKIEGDKKYSGSCVLYGTAYPHRMYFSYIDKTFDVKDKDDWNALADHFLHI